MEKIVHPDDRALVAGHFKDDLTRKETTFVEFRILTRDGEIRWVNHTCHPIFSNEREFNGRRVSNRDITVRKQAEENLLKAYSELELRVQKRSYQLQIFAEKLESRQKELLQHKSGLEKANDELLETNRAVSALARNIDKSRQEMENTISRAINSKIMPIVENLRKAKNLEHLQAELDILSANAQTLISEFGGGANLIATLTPAEMRVATMIKNGLTSQDIADKLHVSLHTVKTHRRNIRKKLNVKNSKINLVSYLQSVMW
jgi:DNA-binding CsgD family transcriptional regulator